MPAEQGIVARADEPAHSLTEQGIPLLPILAQIGIWSRRFRPVGAERGVTRGAGGLPLRDQPLADLCRTRPSRTVASEHHA